jgi:hypothetical protein
MSTFSRSATRVIRLAAVPTLLIAAACSQAKTEAKTPLAQMATGADSTANPHTTMSPDARAALDSGNAQYKAGRFADALKSYRKSSDMAPLNAAPFFGIYMAAEKLGMKALADSASIEIKKRESSSTEMLTDSALQNLHATGAKKGN